MDFETIKNNAMNAFRQLSVLRVIVTSPNEKVADVPALYALAAVLLAPWVCGAALVLGEEGLDGKKLFAAAAGILNDPQRMEEMSKNMAALGIPDATKRIYDTVMSLLK